MLKYNFSERRLVIMHFVGLSSGLLQRLLMYSKIEQYCIFNTLRRETIVNIYYTCSKQASSQVTDKADQLP